MSNSRVRIVLTLSILLGVGTSFLAIPSPVLASHEQPYNPLSCLLGFTAYCLHGDDDSDSDPDPNARDPNADDDGDGTLNKDDECPDDANASKRDIQGKCPSDYINGSNGNVVASNTGTTQQLWAPTQGTGDSSYEKIFELAGDNLANLSSLPPGTSLSFFDFNVSPLELTYDGNGMFTGMSVFGSFWFQWDQAATQTPCDPAVLRKAERRVRVLQRQVREAQEGVDGVNQAIKAAQEVLAQEQEVVVAKQVQLQQAQQALADAQGLVDAAQAEANKSFFSRDNDRVFQLAQQAVAQAGKISDAARSNNAPARFALVSDLREEDIQCAGLAISLRQMDIFPDMSLVVQEAQEAVDAAKKMTRFDDDAVSDAKNTVARSESFIRNELGNRMNFWQAELSRLQSLLDNAQSALEVLQSSCIPTGK